LNQAIADFDRAFAVLEIFKKPAQYKIVEKCLGLRSAFWHHKMPKDAFHVACLGHIARLDNILSSPGINLLEKELLEQRLANIRTAQSIYFQKQKKLL
jgi:hypothetical protein